MTNDELRPRRQSSFHSSFVTRHSSLVLLCLGVLVVNAAERYRPAASQRFEYFRLQMGTKFRIVLYAETEEQARAAAAAAFERIGRLDESLTDYNPESELMQLCNNGH